MGINKSKIPPGKPGQVLKNTGIQEFDDFYAKIEPDIKTVTHRKHDLDHRTTELIESLNAKELWLTSPKAEILIQIILTILSVAGKGNFQSIVNFLQHSPYFQIKAKIPFKYHRVLEKFASFVRSIGKISTQLSGVRLSSKILSHSERIQKNVAKSVIQHDFSIKEKLECIKNVNENHQLLGEFPKDLKNLLFFAQEFKETILRLISEAQVSPFSDVLLQRSIQCISANETAPERIVLKFWPIC